MNKTWKDKLTSTFDKIIQTSLPAAIKSKDGNQPYWYVVENNKRYSTAIIFGKNEAIPEFKIAFYKTEIKDEYAVTSPKAQRGFFEMGWAMTKEIFSLSKDTQEIKDKNKFLHWFFSSQKEWLFVTNEEQLSAITSKALPVAIDKFKRFAGIS